MEIKLKNEDFSMFSKEAKDSLIDHVKEYAVSLKNESERVAASRNEPDGDAKVTKSMVDSMIGVHGHHIVKTPNLFFTYILPVLESLAGALFCSAVLKEEKSFWHEMLMVFSIVAIVVSIFFRHHHDSK